MPTSVFLSCASKEFVSHRELLTKQLLAVGAKVYAQELLQNRGGQLIDLLDDDIQKSEYVVHIVGDRPGDRPGREIVDYIRTAARFGGLAGKVGWDAGGPSAVDPYSLTYTQWEYWLGKYRDKKCLVFLMLADKDPADPSQRDHLGHIRRHGLLRDRPTSEWELVALVLRSLLNLSGDADPSRIAPEPAAPPTVVVVVTATASGYLVNGGVRVRDRYARLADPVEVVVRRGLPPAEELTALAGPFTDLIHRGQTALPEVPKPVVELALPTELLFRPPSDWVFYPNGRARPAEPLGDWFPLRLRLADKPTGQAMRNLDSRLSLLRRCGRRLSSVGPEIPSENLARPDPPPVAVVHEATENLWWQHDGVVCGGFTRPPTTPARTRLWGRPRPAPPIRRVIEHGVPYVVWPERDEVPAAQLAADLRAVGEPDRLCLYFRGRVPRVAVLAEGQGDSAPAGPPLVSGV